mmetsp:Transcript_5331/g.13711  ORF Transcript_5331/g.13711 Transcript_5331/m.13711 type:complete len:100 (-) Transcript_5331:106-405(-)
MERGILWRYPYDTCGVIEVGQEAGAGANSRPEPESELEFFPELSADDAKALVARRFRLAGKGVGSIEAIVDAEAITREIGQQLIEEIERAHRLVQQLKM